MDAKRVHTCWWKKGTSRSLCKISNVTANAMSIFMAWTQSVFTPERWWQKATSQSLCKCLGYSQRSVATRFHGVHRSPARWVCSCTSCPRRSLYRCHRKCWGIHSSSRARRTPPRQPGLCTASRCLCPLQRRPSMKLPCPEDMCGLSLHCPQLEQHRWCSYKVDGHCIHTSCLKGPRKKRQ